jgi:glycosyltransferase involved in cell wall biosynthesis
MKIGLDLRMIGGGSGIDTYISELTHEILKNDKHNQYVLFFRSDKLSEAYQSYGHKIVVADIPHYSLAEQTKLPGILAKENVDLMHFPHFNVPLLYRRPFVVTIHDLTHTLIPGKKKSHFFHRLAYHAVFRNAVSKAKKIIAVSQSTKNQITSYYSLDPNKVQVVYEGFKQLYKMMDKEEAYNQVAAKFKVTKPYLLYVGVWRRYKNLPMLAQAFDKLKEQGLDLELVLAGEPDKFYPEIEQQVFAIENKAAIKAVGRVSDEDLKLLYNAAALFVLPSHMEGFGLTALEAAACGVPVACSDIPTLHEVMGQGAEYFDPENLENMVEVISGILNNRQRLEDLANASLSRSKHFSWKQAADETVKVYEEAGK